MKSKGAKYLNAIIDNKKQNKTLVNIHIQLHIYLFYKFSKGEREPVYYMFIIQERAETM